ncbi:hypothetical protein H1R20_g15297, partial [Candolleomyces eurysporus]
MSSEITVEVDSTLPPVNVTATAQHNATSALSGSTPSPPPLTDSLENPFLSAESSPTSDSSGSDSGTLGAIGAFAILPTVARPALQRPRAGPHSIARGSPHSRSTSPTGSASDDDSELSSDDSAPANRGKRYDAQDVWLFYKEDSTSHRYHCIFCLSRAAAGTLEDNQYVKHYNKKSGTGTMRRHLYGHHRDEWVAGCDRQGLKIIVKEAQKHVSAYRQAQGQTPMGGSDTSRPNIPEFTHDAFIEALVDFVIADDQSINVVESAFFRRLILMLREELRDEDIPHRTFIRNRIQERWETYMMQLQSELQNSVGRISLTTDMWSDPNLRPYMAVTAHWIKAKIVQTAEGAVTNLVLRADLLAFHNLPGRHTGEHLATALLHVLDRLNIAKRIGWVTLDNASNNATMMEHLADLLNQRNIIFSDKDNRIRCFSHITNLASRAILAAVTNIGLAAVNDDEVDPEEDISTDANRDIIAHARNLIRVFINKMVSVRELQRYRLKETEWEALNMYIEILRVPHAFQQKLSHEKIPTLYQALPHFHRMVGAWKRKKEEMPQYRNIINVGISKLEDYLDNIKDVPAYTLAILITPTIKLTWHQKYDADRVVWAKRLFVDSLKPYRQGNGVNTPAPRRTAQSDAWADDALGSPIARPDNRHRTIQAEVDAYLVDGRLTCRLIKENRTEYPTIHQLAMDILPIPGSAVPCERVFSSAKETMTLRRRRIRPALMEALQVLKFSLKGGPGLDFTAGTGRDAKIEVLEGVATDSGRLPDDITSYLNHLLHEPVFDDDSDEEDDNLEGVAS